ARDAIRSHSVRNRSTSASLVAGPKLTRIVAPAMSDGTCIATSTALPFIAPDEQALPIDTAIPARSNWTSSDAFEAPGRAIAPIVGIRGLLFLTITAPAAVAR